MSQVTVAVEGTTSHSRSRIGRRLLAVVALVIVADWLFYWRTPGISITLFFLALAAASIAVNEAVAPRWQVFAASTVLLLGLLPTVLKPDLVSTLFGGLGTAFFVLAMNGKAGRGWADNIRRPLALLGGMVWRFAPGLARLARFWARSRQGRGYRRALLTWIVPLLVGGLFLFLFYSANPLIAAWIKALDILNILHTMSSGRPVFWLCFLAIAWPFVFLHVGRKRIEVRALVPALSKVEHPLFGKDAIFKSLVLFNALFAVQTILDLFYLWGGVKLPAGTDYASYAHEGAYTLMLTAILAAAFVLAAMRRGSESSRSVWVRRLVYLWTLQNVVLVCSSMLRLDLYVRAYALTYWRVAALIWMLLVAVGLVLIMARIALDRGNRWLIGMNLASLALVLYLCSLANFPMLIASYNIAHAAERPAGSASLDVEYLAELGPWALPAIDRYLADSAARHRRRLAAERDRLAARHVEEQEDWRAWSFYDWRLSRYLARNSRYENVPLGLRR
ncbi:MAG: DUF4173 domain-containing protein [Parvibaculaceae bacterium]